MAVFRRRIFEDHMPEALYGTVLGDSGLIRAYPQLLDSPVYVHFHGQGPAAKVSCWGTVRDICELSRQRSALAPAGLPSTFPEAIEPAPLEQARGRM